MKKLFLSILLVVVLMTGVNVFAEENDDWAAKPIITDIYELEKEKLLLEWDGNSTIYQIYVDGKEVSTVNIKFSIIDIKPGAHQIVVIPIDYKSKDGDKQFSGSLELGGLSDIANKVEATGLSDVFNKIPGLSLLNNLSDLNIGFSLDLSAFGIDPKDLIRGTSSDTIKINYSVNPILNSTPEIISAVTNKNDNVVLTFSDKYNADSYQLTIKNGNDVNYIDFDTASKEASSFIEKENTNVTITLDPEYLKANGCMIPELEQKYSFTVKLQKWPLNYIDGEKETIAVLESRNSKSFDFTPHAAWKNAPVITYASQTGDGKVTLQWDHEDAIPGCEYKVMKIDTIMGVKTGEAKIGKTTQRDFVVSDLLNGKYNFAVVPLFGDEIGFASESVSAEVNNEWVTAPALECEVGKNNQIILTWTSPKEIESYHITVSVASGSLLRFVNMDYEKHTEFDVQAKSGNMKYTYVYDGEVNPESEVKLKFEIYGIRHAADGTEQKSASSSQEIILN